MSIYGLFSVWAERRKGEIVIEIEIDTDEIERERLRERQRQTEIASLFSF
jgi:hypothetical protein